MLFAPARLGNTTLGREELAADRKSCKRFGPCGVGEKALYLNSFFIDRRYYVALSSVRRVFKRVAMSKGGFSGKGVFGSIPYLVVEYDGGQVKQCTFKHEDDVDRMIECIARYLPDIPLHSEKVERHLAEQKAEKAQRYVRNLTADAETTRAHFWRRTMPTRRRSSPARQRPSASTTTRTLPISGSPSPSSSPVRPRWSTASSR